MSGPLPHVVVLGTGGTIASSAPDRMEQVDYATGASVHVAELLAAVPETAAVADVEGVQLFQRDSANFEVVDLVSIGEAVERELDRAPGLHGIVLLHGTATLEETAYFLSLTVRRPPVLVLTGALRPLSALGSDALPNLLAAVRVAASPCAARAGVVVVMSDRIAAARDVSKESNYRLDAFGSRDHGPLGHVEPDGLVVLDRLPAGSVQPPFSLAAARRAPRVDIACSYVGSDGAAIDAFVDAGAAGVVCAGLGPGWMTPAEEKAAQRARERGVAVVLSSRTGAGRVLGRAATREVGIVTATDLSPQKARILLSLALTGTRDPHELQDCFDRA